MTPDPTSPLAGVRVRYLVIAWLLLIIYVPGAGEILAIFGRGLSPHMWTMLYILYAQAFVAVALYVAFRVPATVRLTAIVGRQPDTHEYFSALKFCVFLYLVAWAALYLHIYPLSLWFPEFVEFWFIQTIGLTYYDAAEMSYPILANFLNLVSLSVLAPIIEELAFRGIILHRWAYKYGLKKAVIFSSLLFGLVHPDPLGAFIFGVGMCVLYLRSQSILLPIFCHSAYNFFVWILDLWWTVSHAPDHAATLEQFQAEWPYGLAAGIVVLIWTVLYLRNPGPHTTWRLPAL